MFGREDEESFKKRGGVDMKRVGIFFLSFLLVFLSIGAGWSRVNGTIDNGTIYGMDEERFSLQVKAMVCTAAEDEITENVIHGRLIRAFELCRKQGSGIEECVERIQKIREKWRQRGCGEDSAWIIRYHYNRAVARVKEIEAKLKNTVNPRILIDPAVAMFYFESLNKNFAQLFPGSQFSFQTGTGKVVLGEGEIHFQGWRWTQYNIWREGGILIQTFPGRINWVMDRYNISVYLETEPKPRWEVIDFNLPFDMQSEKILLALGQGVRISEREIIRLVDIFLHDTVWGLDVTAIFPSLLTQRELREDFLRAMVEYFTYDNYIAKERAAAKKRSKPEQQQQGGEGKTGQKRKKK
jgi:hypothetical protein